MFLSFTVVSPKGGESFPLLAGLNVQSLIDVHFVFRNSQTLTYLLGSHSTLSNGAESKYRPSPSIYCNTSVIGDSFLSRFPYCVVRFTSTLIFHSLFTTDSIAQLFSIIYSNMLTEFVCKIPFLNQYLIYFLFRT